MAVYMNITSIPATDILHVKELNHVGKLDDRSSPGVFIGYAEGVKAYHVLDPATRRVRVARDVVFDEGRDWAWDKAVDDGSRPLRHPSRLLRHLLLRPLQPQCMQGSWRSST